MKRILYAAALLLLPFLTHAQAYFQQRVDTKIEVRLDDKAHLLHGFESFRYTNNSPDTLRYIYVHLWPNAYSSDRTRFSEQQVLNRNTAFYFSKPSERGYMDSLDFRIDGQAVSPYSAEGLPDIARIDLPAPLTPGATIEVETPFRVKIPKVFSRLGHNGQAYYISQWFPKPAVYDRKGWHPLPYLDQGEFYSEIGSYDVRITLPKNYVVMGTGNYMDEKENAWLDSFSRQPMPAGKRPGTHAKAWRQKVNAMPPSSAEYKTVHMHEDNVHDFAWFADKRYIVRKDTVTVPAAGEAAENTVTVYTAFLPAEKDYWAKSSEYIRKTIQAYSRQVGPYPYKTVKAVEGNLRAGGGMEYPTVTIVDARVSQSSLREVLVHEVGHNWFYGILATNERDIPWADEGFNTFYERKVVQDLRRSAKEKEQYSNRLEDALYLSAAATRTDQSLTNTSAAFTKGNYGVDAYYKTALMLGWLEGYMGADTFRAAMQEYYLRWKFRHPYPEDIEQVFRSATSKPISWFFERTLQTDKGIDFALKRVKKTEDGFMARVRNNTGFDAPAGVTAYVGDSIAESAWTLPFGNDTILSLKNHSARKWRISPEIPDYYGLNNRYSRSGLLHGQMPKLRFGLGIGRREPAEIYVLPALGFNEYDGLMPGLLLHNFALPQNRFRYAIAGLYGTRSEAFAGAGSLGYWIYPNNVFQEIVPQVDFKTFHYDQTTLNIPAPLNARYIKLAPSLSFVFRNSSALSEVTRTLTIKGYSIWEEGFSFSPSPADSNQFVPSIVRAEQNNYGMLRYTHNNARTFNPFSYRIEGQLGQSFAKLSAEGNLRIDYNVRNKSLYLRGFAGKFISGNAMSAYRYWLTTTYTAANDYLYDGTYFARSQRDGQMQVSIQEGGQKLPTLLYGFPLGRSDDWLLSLNVKSDLPLGWLPVRLYLDATTYSGAADVNPSGNRFLYAGGVELHALRDVILVHIPLVLSQDYRDYLKSIYPDKQLANSITFSVQLQNINWLRSITSGLKHFVF